MHTATPGCADVEFTVVMRVADSAASATLAAELGAAEVEAAVAATDDRRDWTGAVSVASSASAVVVASCDGALGEECGGGGDGMGGGAVAAIVVLVAVVIGVAFVLKKFACSAGEEGVKLNEGAELQGNSKV